MATVDERFTPVDEPTTEAAPLPPPPRINGVPADVWAQGLDRKLDTLFAAHHEAIAALAADLRASRAETRDGLDRISESLKVIERHEVALQGHQKQLDEHRRLLFAQGDRQNEIVERQEQLEQRVAALELAPKKARRPNKRARRK